MPDLSQNVEAILREVAHKIVMPSFKNLAADRDEALAVNRLHKSQV